MLIFLIKMLFYINTKFPIYFILIKKIDKFYIINIFNNNIIYLLKFKKIKQYLKIIRYYFYISYM